MSDKKIRMTEPRKEIFNRLQSGVALISEKTDFGGQVFAFSDGGSVSQGIVQRLIGVGALKAAGDGFFGDSQSYLWGGVW